MKGPASHLAFSVLQMKVSLPGFGFSPHSFSHVASDSFDVLERSHFFVALMQAYPSLEGAGAGGFGFLHSSSQTVAVWLECLDSSHFLVASTQA